MSDKRENRSVRLSNTDDQRDACFLGIDQGTSASKVVLVDRDGHQRAGAHREVATYCPGPGVCEQDAQELLDQTLTAIDDVLLSAQVSPKDIVAVGIANQRCSLVIWDRHTGKPYGPVRSWLDQRAQSLAATITGRTASALLRRTGMPPLPLTLGAILANRLREDPILRRRAEAGELLAGPVSSWLIWKLSGGTRFC